MLIPVQVFVKENQLYSFADLERKNLNESSIKILCRSGILRCSNNTHETDDLLDEIDVNPYTSCYRFRYVGIICLSDIVIKVYPKYLPDILACSTSESIQQSFAIALRAIEHHKKQNKQLDLLQFSNEGKDWGSLRLIIFLIRDYYENGLYHTQKEIKEINGPGSIFWEKTLYPGNSIVQNGIPYYIDLCTHRYITNEDDLFHRLHRAILTEGSLILAQIGLNQILNFETLHLSDETPDSFGDKKTLLTLLERRLSSTFDDRGKLLLAAMARYLGKEVKLFEKDSGITLFGTSVFHVVWEDACKGVFSDCLNKTLTSIPLPRGKKLEPSFNKNALLKDLLESPKWIIDELTVYGYEEEANNDGKLIPDVVSINGDYFDIIDAKYYIPQLSQDRRKIFGCPGVGDITKQHLYQLAFASFIEKHGFRSSNTFVMPYVGKASKTTAVCMSLFTLSNISSALNLIHVGIQLEPSSKYMLSPINVRFINPDSLFTYWLNGRTITIHDPL